MFLSRDVKQVGLARNRFIKTCNRLGPFLNQFMTALIRLMDYYGLNLREKLIALKLA